MRETGLQQTPFNSSLAFLERIEDTWKLVTEAKIKGEITTYFRTLEDIFRSVHPIFDKEPPKEGSKTECEQCEELIKECELHLSQNNSADSWVGENKCDKLKMLLVKLLFKYKITYFKQDHQTWEDELKEDFE